jgi:phosphohistidine swiveling domain-containing protein
MENKDIEEDDFLIVDYENKKIDKVINNITEIITENKKGYRSHPAVKEFEFGVLSPVQCAKVFVYKVSLYP